MILLSVCPQNHKKNFTGSCSIITLVLQIVRNSPFIQNTKKKLLSDIRYSCKNHHTYGSMASVVTCLIVE